MRINNTAFTLLEILLSSIIFVISVAGVFATLNAVRGPVINKENQLAAAILSKQVLESLYAQVSYGGTNAYYNSCGSGHGSGTAADPCREFSFSLGEHLTPLPASLSWPAGFTAVNTGLAYTVSCADGSGSCGNGTNIARQVNVHINWPTVP